MLHNKEDYASDVVTTVNDKTIGPVEMDNFDMSLSKLETDFISDILKSNVTMIWGLMNNPLGQNMQLLGQ